MPAGMHYDLEMDVTQPDRPFPKVLMCSLEILTASSLFLRRTDLRRAFIP